jgi:hypothetical protein
MASLEELTPEQRQALNLGELAKKLVQTPETSAAMKRLLMKGDPKVRFPEIELEDKVGAVREETDGRIKELEQKLAKQEAERRLEKLHSKVHEAGLELKPVVELMEKHGLSPTDEGYDIAIEVLRSRAATVSEPTADFTPFELPNIKEMWDDPVKWREKEGYKALKEFRGGKLVQ